MESKYIHGNRALHEAYSNITTFKGRENGYPQLTLGSRQRERNRVPG